MNNIIHIITSPFKNAWQGAMKIKSFIPIYGIKRSFEIILKNILWLETVVRLEKDLSTSDPKVEPKVPINVVRYSRDIISLDDWKNRDAIIRIRGEYGLTQFQKHLDRGDFFYTAYWEDKFLGFLMG